MVRASAFVALSYQILNARAANPMLSNIVLSSAAGKWLEYSNRFAPSMPLSKGLAAVLVTASQPGLSARPIPLNSWLMWATVASKLDKAPILLWPRLGHRLRLPTVRPLSSHDLRRTFCTRWSRKVMPAILQKLARHSSVQTTLTYYVSLDAVAEELREDSKSTTSNTTLADERS